MNLTPRRSGEPNGAIGKGVIGGKMVDEEERLGLAGEKITISPANHV